MTQKFHSQVYIQQKSMHMCMKSPTKMVMAALIIMLYNWKQLKCASTVE